MKKRRLKYIEAAERGALWLDDHANEFWWDEINLETLDMRDSALCIIGQLFGSYFMLPGMHILDPISHGFTTNCAHTNEWDEAREWIQLQEAWVAVLEARHATNVH